MDRAQLIRRLRIAASVFFAVVTVALCVLWVRSYWHIDFVERDTPRFLRIISSSGSIQLQRENKARPGALITPWRFETIETPATDAGKLRTVKYHMAKVTRGSLSTFVTIPYWMMTPWPLVFAIAALFLRTSFSLRTLLITTTLVAVVLGLGVWAAG